MCTAAGHAVLRVIHEEKLQDNALLVGSHLKRRLAQLKDKHEREFLSKLKDNFSTFFFVEIFSFLLCT